jgi:hypothetical protein
MSRFLTSTDDGVGWFSMRCVPILGLVKSEPHFFVPPSGEIVVFTIEDRCYFYNLSEKMLHFSLCPVGTEYYQGNIIPHDKHGTLCDRKKNVVTYHANPFSLSFYDEFTLCQVSLTDNTVIFKRDDRIITYERNPQENVTQYFVYRERYYSVTREMDKWYVTDLVNKSRIRVYDGFYFKVWVQRDRIFCYSSAGITMLTTLAYA